jgi:hypothetical protein
VGPSDAEVELEVSLDVDPGDPVVVELALRAGGVDVYRGGPVAVIPTEEPVPVPVRYVGATACSGTSGSAVIGPLGGTPSSTTGRLEIGDCYLGSEASFADRWSLEITEDLGLEAEVVPASATEIRVALEAPDGTTLATGTGGRLQQPLAAGTYVVRVTTVEPLAEGGYELRLGEYDRCDLAAGELFPGAVLVGALDRLDCPLSDGTSADVWELEVTTGRAYRIDLESNEFDARLLVTEASVVDPRASGVLLEDDDSGVETNALIAGPLAPGRYRVWASSFGAGEAGDYQLSMQPLNTGAPTVEVRSVSALGVGGLGGVCGAAQTFVFAFGFEDGDGDLVAPGGVTLRVTGIPSGFQEIKTSDWGAFTAIGPFAGFADLVSCETFLSGDTGKRAEFFITDAAGRSSAIFSTVLSPVTGSGTP